MIKIKFLLFTVFFILNTNVFSQDFDEDFFILDEIKRRNSILDTSNNFLGLRPNSISFFEKYSGSSYKNEKSFVFRIYPLIFLGKFNSKRPYGWGDFLLTPNVGIQNYLSLGFQFNFEFFKIDFKPELSYSQNKSYLGFSSDWPNSVLKNKFFHWNFGDFPERFGDSSLGQIWFGQSSISFFIKNMEVGMSTKNIWWGPSQFNSLSFSNNSKGFPKFFITSYKPLNTPFGAIEFSLISGKLKNSGFAPSQNTVLNNLYFKNQIDDWKYLNAVFFDYSPKWIPSIHLGFIRTFQVYSKQNGYSFNQLFPIFEGFQKKKFFKDGNSVLFDSNGRSQQMIVFGKLVLNKAKSEIYFELGRRDHAFNWRDYVLNPEHARGFIFGFFKLFPLNLSPNLLQIRGEITHQQESINRVVRYDSPGGFLSWHMHGQTRGFVNEGQGLGVGVGQGGNVQSLEFSLVKDFNKLGLKFERLENDLGFYYRSFYLPSENKSWVDLSLGLLYDKKVNNLFFNSKIQFIQARNYQWQLHSDSTPEFPKGLNLNSLLFQVSGIYFIKRK